MMACWMHLLIKISYNSYGYLANRLTWMWNTEWSNEENSTRLLRYLVH
jgi:hypothetical protein